MAALLYGAPAPGLVEVPAGVVQLSPLIPGSTDIAGLAAASADSATVLADDYRQETGVRLASETHGGGDVKLLAGGAGASVFKGTMDNTKVFGLLKSAFGF